MMDIDKIIEDIKKLEDGPMTWANCERLANHYTIQHHHEKRADIESIGEAMIKGYEAMIKELEAIKHE